MKDMDKWVELCYYVSCFDGFFRAIKLIQNVIYTVIHVNIHCFFINVHAQISKEFMITLGNTCKISNSNVIWKLLNKVLHSNAAAKVHVAPHFLKEK